MAGRPRVALEERFWARVDKGDPDECWEWTGNVNVQGYGQINEGGRGSKMLKAHRLSYQLNNGELEDGMSICHSCDNTTCVNPAHLWQGTQAQNNEDRRLKGRNGVTGPRGSKNVGMDGAILARHAYRELGWSQVRIAKVLGVAQHAISKIVRDESYQET